MKLLLMLMLLPLALPAGETGVPVPVDARLEVRSLVPNGPAAQAGLQPGDVLKSYHGTPVHTLAELAEVKTAVKTDSVTLLLARGSGEVSVRVPAGQLGVLLQELLPDIRPDSDAQVIPGVAPLSWSTGKENSFMAALEAVLRHLGRDADYIYLSGVSGAAFRTHFFDTWCPSSPDPGCGYDATTPALTAYGYRAECLPLGTDGKNRPQIVAAIRKSIDDGVPVLAWDLVEMPECGIITGYQKQGEEFFCRTCFDKRKGYELAQKFPFVSMVLHPGEPAPEPKTSCRQGFKIVADNLTTEKYGQYYSGLAAFDKWQERLRSDDFTRLDSAALSNVVQANYWIFNRIITDRRAGIEYLAQVAKLLPAHQPEYDRLTTIYRKEADILAPLLPELPCPGTCTKAAEWPRELRDRQIALLAQARELEAQALPIWQRLAAAE